MAEHKAPAASMTGPVETGGEAPHVAAASPPPIRKGLVLAIACTSTFLVNMDNTIVNVALPDIRAHLHPSVAGLQWIVDSYLLTLASLLILSGSLGDRFGRRRIFQYGLVAFALGSLLSGLAPDAGWLVAFRVLQAVGASMLNPVAMSIIGNVFVDARERAQAFGVWGTAVGLGMASGPVLGGLTVQEWGWRTVFWIGVPIALAVAACTRLYVPESKALRYRRPDLLGQALVLVFLASVIFSIIEVPRLGLSSPPIVTGLATAVTAAATLGRVERRRIDPLIEFRFFRSVPFSAAMVIAVLTYSAIGGFLFLNTIYLQDVRGYTPLCAGLYTLPMALSTSLGAYLAGRLVQASGARTALIASGTAIIGAAVTTGVAIGGGGLIPLLAGYTLLGLGFGGANTPVNDIAMAAMPRSQAGVAGATASSSRQVGQSLGVAAFGALLGADAAPVGADFVQVSRASWSIIAAIGLAIIAVGIIACHRAAQRTAQRIATELCEL